MNSSTYRGQKRESHLLGFGVISSYELPNFGPLQEQYMILMVTVSHNQANIASHGSVKAPHSLEDFVSFCISLILTASLLVLNWPLLFRSVTSSIGLSV